MPAKAWTAIETYRREVAPGFFQLHEQLRYCPVLFQFHAPVRGVSVMRDSETRRGRGSASSCMPAGR